MMKEEPTVTAALTVVWSMKFMATLLTDGGKFRILNVLNDLKPAGLDSEVDFLLPAERMVRTLNQIRTCRP